MTWFDEIMDVAAQWVRTSWTKRSRGGPDAARRNAAPVMFPLPDVPLPMVHEVTVNESTQFEPQSTVRQATPGTNEVSLVESDGLLRVYLVVTAYGRPSRPRRPPAVRLARGEWLRWQINYRFVGDITGDWYYRQDTLNLAYGRDFSGSPKHYVDERARLP